jgi:hypothetical protein
MRGKERSQVGVWQDSVPALPGRLELYHTQPNPVSFNPTGSDKLNINFLKISVIHFYKNIRQRSCMAVVCQSAFRIVGAGPVVRVVS